MRLHYLGLLVGLTLTHLVSGQLPSSFTQLSPKASVSILTCAPGNELYSVFGHTAIRITDPEKRIDLAFNFGTFDFNTSFFYLKFGHGTLDYILSVSSFRQFMQEYFITGRSVREQRLDLLPEQKMALFRALMDNALPQNRAYRYDFFKDNCATRVRDGVLDVLDGSLMSNDSIEGNTHSTFRQAIHPFLANQPWTRLGIDLLLGSPADEPADFWSMMFLPRHLMEGLGALQVKSDGKTKPLVSETTQLLEFNDPKPMVRLLSPLWSLWLLALIVLFISLLQAYDVVRLRWLNPVLFTLLGLVGILIGYLSFVSQHVATGHNWNFLWANPLWWGLITNVTKRRRVVLSWLLMGALLYLLFFSWSLTQHFPPELYPIWILLILRLGLKLLKKA